MSQFSRRYFLKTSAAGVAATASAQGFANTSELSKKTIAQVKALEAKEIQATTDTWNDGLAHPIPYKNAPGAGKDRAIVLGGGSEYMSSFLVGYFHAMLTNGVNLRAADIVVGTSAGAVLGSALLGSRLDLFSRNLTYWRTTLRSWLNWCPRKAFLQAKSES